ncbi:MAG: hypothetical protein OEV64_02360 [Desulfobulbaceae bacterium]|nr:hypothetical protein [Desulfobulbaceae bacterium]
MIRQTYDHTRPTLPRHDLPLKNKGPVGDQCRIILKGHFILHSADYLAKRVLRKSRGIRPS